MSLWAPWSQLGTQMEQLQVNAGGQNCGLEPLYPVHHMMSLGAAWQGDGREPGTPTGPTVCSRTPPRPHGTTRPGHSCSPGQSPPLGVHSLRHGADSKESQPRPRRPPSPVVWPLGGPCGNPGEGELGTDVAPSQARNCLEDTWGVCWGCRPRWHQRPASSLEPAAAHCPKTVWLCGPGRQAVLCPFQGNGT